MNEFENKIKSLITNSQSLRDFIFNTAKADKSLILKNTGILEGLLSCESWEVKEAVLFALLSRCNVKDDSVIKKALSLALNKEEYVDVRVAAVSGLGSTFNSTCNVELLKSFKSIISDNLQGPYLRNVALKNTLEVYGLKYLDIFKRAARKKNIDEEFFENIKEFEKELKAIEHNYL